SVPDANKILYAYDNGYEKIYFTKNGLIYEHRKDFILTENQREALEEGKDVSPKPPEILYVNMTWVDADYSSMEVEVSEKQGHYISYGTKEYNAYTYKKLTYKNVYDKIDVEYTIPEDKERGIKYSVIVHPGADLSKFRIQYSGDV